MKTSIATVSISGNLQEKLEAISTAGFDGIEIFEQDFIANERGTKDVGRMIREHGLEITLFQPFRDFEGLPEPLRSKAFDRAERKFDLMNELGADLVLMCSSVHPQALGGIDRAADDFNELGERAKKRGIRIGYEALAWGRHVNDHRDAWEIVRRADHQNIGLILDSFHTLGRKIDPDTIRRIPADKIFFVQLADAPAIEMDLLYWSRHFRNMPGEGDLPVTKFMQAVMATGYSGPISLEIFNDQFRGGSTLTIAKDGYRSLIALMDDVRNAEPDLNFDLEPIPARSEITGTSFIEFASKGGEANKLANLLATLGFQETGKHVSKNVTLWQQGEIRIIINQETIDYAGSAYNLHGTSVCDIGISVKNANDTIQRANHLGSKTFTQKLSAGQLDIPAIRGLGGSILHLLDDSHSSVWEKEFKATGSGSKITGLTGIDHIAQTVTYDEMLSWSLFYTALFDMKRSAMQDVIDPDGLVRSTGLSAKNNGFRVTLNGAETHRTLAGSFLADSSGAPVQHIAFSTDDIFSTASAMNELGFKTLPIPENYYIDLPTRLNVDNEQLERMREHNILFDQDQDGEFLQFYSQPFAEGMFFEIVQRINSYQGYGAPNAPFRIAAQKRLLRAKGIPRK